MRNLARATPYLAYAAGILAATAASVLTQAHGAWVLSGPGVLALALFGAVGLLKRTGAPAPPLTAVLVHAASFALAGGILAVADPALVPAFVPILGAGAGVSLLPVTPCRRARDTATGA